MSDAYCVPLYKSTRPDGTDFYTGSVDYAAALASGEPLPELSGEGEFPGPGWYHLATVPTECAGMSWPCRLFEVEPVGDQVVDSGHPYKVGCRQVRVVREVDGHVALGPQGKQVSALIDRAGALTQQALGGAFAARDAALDAAWVAARDAALDAAWVAARDAALDAALDAAWDAAWGAARGAALDAALDAAWDAAWGAARGAALGAAWDATRALVSHDLIGHHPGWDQCAYDLLTGPWRSVIGPVHPDDPTPP